MDTSEVRAAREEEWRCADAAKGPRARDAPEGESALSRGTVSKW
jgi:hypothetical protein